ncbi:MAG: hypothetical protein J5829_00565, partial [Lachnospiraceae bacterium]|nr:hypothetical protein [Lachnospiraceae bacterium]
MSTDEDYLDQLLHAVTENYREEQGITGEPEPEVGEKFVSNPEAVLTSEPLVEHMQENEPAAEPETETVYEPVTGQEPVSEQTPDFDTQNIEEMPMEGMAMEEMPMEGMAMEEMPMEGMAMEEMPMEGMAME